MSDKRTKKAIGEMLLSEGFTVDEINDFFKDYKKTTFIYGEYEKEALSRIFSGNDRLGSKHIVEDLRARLKIHISNDYTAIYSRIFVFLWPQFRKKFVFKPVGERLAA